MIGRERQTNKMCCVSVDSEEQTDLNYTFNTY